MGRQKCVSYPRPPLLQLRASTLLKQSFPLITAAPHALAYDGKVGRDRMLFFLMFHASSEPEFRADLLFVRAVWLQKGCIISVLSENLIARLPRRLTRRIKRAN